MKKLQLRVGAYYKRRDGHVVGPAEKTRAGSYAGVAFKVGYDWYYSDGKWSQQYMSPSDLISECTKSGHPIRPAKKPTPKKRAGGKGDGQALDVHGSIYHRRKGIGGHAPEP